MTTGRINQVAFHAGKAFVGSTRPWSQPLSKHFPSHTFWPRGRAYLSCQLLSFLPCLYRFSVPPTAKPCYSFCSSSNCPSYKRDLRTFSHSEHRTKSLNSLYSPSPRGSGTLRRGACGRQLGLSPSITYQRQCAEHCSMPSSAPPRIDSSGGWRHVFCISRT